jgi:hypothetical protein
MKIYKMKSYCLVCILTTLFSFHSRCRHTIYHIIAHLYHTAWKQSCLKLTLLSLTATDKYTFFVEPQVHKDSAITKTETEIGIC